MSEDTTADEACTLLVDGACVDIQTCAKRECPESCHDEFHATLACVLQDVGCTGNECSPGFKARVTAASAVGAAIIGWMVM